MAAGLSLPTSAYAGSETVLDKQLDVIPGWEISDIIAATVTYGTSRITIEVEHSEWIQNWKRQPAATGGRLTFSNGRTYIITPGASGRKSVLATLKQFRHCVAQPKGGPWGEPCRSLKCSGWTYAIDKANGRTAVSVPVRCFPSASAKVKVLPIHMITDYSGEGVIDPIDSTGWIKRG